MDILRTSTAECMHDMSTEFNVSLQSFMCFVSEIDKSFTLKECVCVLGVGVVGGGAGEFFTLLNV